MGTAKFAGELPVTVSTEYKDVSLLLLALTRGFSDAAPFTITATSALGLTYSATASEVRPMLHLLKRSLLSVSADSEVMARETEAIGYAAHVLFHNDQWDVELRNHQEELIDYFQKIEHLQWLRTPSVAASFVFGFSRQAPFGDLVHSAKEYLSLEVGKAQNASLPVAAFGLWAGGEHPQIPEGFAERWLAQKHRTFRGLCMLAVVLDSINHPQAKFFLAAFQEEAAKTYTEIVVQNLDTIRALLAVLHLAEMGQDADQITRTLSNPAVIRNFRDRVSAVIRAGSQVFVEFQSDFLAKTPTLENMVFYLFCAHSLGLMEAYIVDRRLGADFRAFVEEWQGQSKSVHENVLLLLLLVSLTAGMFALIQIWWPFSNQIYEWLMEWLGDSQGLLASFLDDFLKGIILLPFYFFSGSALAVWLRGRVMWSDVTPEKVADNAWTLVNQILKRNRKS